MNALQVYDTLKLNFSEEQAHLLSEVLQQREQEKNEQLTATKKDIKQLEYRIEQVKSDLELKIGQLRNDLEQVKSDLELKIEQLRNDLMEKIHSVDLKIEQTRADIGQSKADILKWMTGLMVTQTGVIIAIVFGLIKYMS
jgi:chromosome segregation ATPase